MIYHYFSPIELRVAGNLAAKTAEHILPKLKVCIKIIFF